ncbi:peptidase MA family metallohydrolase [Desulforamulus putei]|uniref:Peptidase MA superfamily protein n=1 Tax=Desulforamulus putei DSM 12395 TaxID=1121429 RepID=A0A1M4Y175_9FIRM|nr:peptidase MA family metallohydrolase [Desulforamulus putei]SHE99430.1 Peptidase MA superfamily protein [Desulforamulus putei DSM 12395]
MPGIVQNTDAAGMHRFLGITLAAFIVLAAFFVKLPNAVRSAAYTVFREGLKQKALWTTRHMETLNGEHFIVRYTEGNEADAQLVLAAAEKFYSPIAEKYGYAGRSKIPVIVYPSRAELNRNFGWQANESAMGVYWTGVIRVLSPNVWVTEEDPHFYREEFMNAGPMAHEFTHLVVDYVTAGNYTRWFTEGIAQYEEYKLTGFEFQDMEASLDQPLYRLDEMDMYFDNLPNQPLAYRQSYLAVRYVAEVYGEASIKNILKSLAQNNKIDRAIPEVLGVKMETFEKNYQHWSREQEKLRKL